MSEINWRRAARGRVSLRGRRARASEGRLFVCFETGRPQSTRRAALASWVRWTVDPRSMLREAAVTAPACRQWPGSSVYSPGDVVAQLPSHPRRLVAAKARPLRGPVRQDARGAPDGRVERLTQPRRRHSGRCSCRITCETSPRRRSGGVAAFDSLALSAFVRRRRLCQTLDRAVITVCFFCRRTAQALVFCSARENEVFAARVDAQSGQGGRNEGLLRHNCAGPNCLSRRVRV